MTDERLKDLRAARLKLRQLQREIRAGRSSVDLQHTLLKATQYLEDAVGREVWLAANPDDDRKVH